MQRKKFSNKTLFCPHCGARLKAQVHIAEMLGLLGSYLGVATGSSMVFLSACIIIVSGGNNDTYFNNLFLIGGVLLIFALITFIILVIRR
jgi:hypothetical protein